jgi:hypothetical protein
VSGVELRDAWFPSSPPADPAEGELRIAIPQVGEMVTPFVSKLFPKLAASL